ncbi:MAG: PE-PGRS family protein, partial [Deltaproteobacteria bacterium]|nr:PE-PGRS family protein [Deltaproteobacteria bacterium]
IDIQRGAGAIAPPTNVTGGGAANGGALGFNGTGGVPGNGGGAATAGAQGPAGANGRAAVGVGGNGTASAVTGP